MSFGPNHEELRDLQQELHRARTITPGHSRRYYARVPTLPDPPSCREGKGHSPDRIGRLLRRSACAARAGTATMEASSSRLRDRRMDLLAFETAGAFRRTRRDGRSPPREFAAGDPERIGRRVASEPQQRRRRAQVRAAGWSQTRVRHLLRQFRMIRDHRESVRWPEPSVDDRDQTAGESHLSSPQGSWSWLP